MGLHCSDPCCLRINCTIPFYRKDLSIHRFCYLLGILEPISCEYHWGMVAYYSIVHHNHIDTLDLQNKMIILYKWNLKLFDQHLPTSLLPLQLMAASSTLCFYDFGHFRFHIKVRSHSDLCLAFCAWLTSLSIIFARFIRTVSNVRISLFLRLIIFQSVYICFHSSVDYYVVLTSWLFWVMLQ